MRSRNTLTSSATAVDCACPAPKQCETLYLNWRVKGFNGGIKSMHRVFTGNLPLCAKKDIITALFPGAFRMVELPVKVTCTLDEHEAKAKVRFAPQPSVLSHRCVGQQ